MAQIIEPFSGNWRDYFNVPSKGKHAAVMIKIFDDIVATGPDGINLLMHAYHRLKSDGKRFEKIEVTNDPVVKNFLSEHKGSVAMPGRFNIDIEQALAIAVKDKDGISRSLSITGITVHELFHMADPNVGVKATEDTQRQLSISTKSLSADQKKSVMKAVGKLIVEANSIEDALVKAAKNPKQFLHRVASMAGVPYGSFDIPVISNPKAAVAKLKRHSDTAEEDATRYTDTFMAKHFPGEPWRGKYKNAHYQLPLQEPIIREPGCGIVHKNTYEARTINTESLGNFSQPAINKLPSPFCQKTK